MKKTTLITIVLILLVSGLACRIPFIGDDNADDEKTSGAAEQAAVEIEAQEEKEDSEAKERPESAAVDVDILGELIEVAEGGFSYRTIPGYQTEEFSGLVYMLAPGADEDLGPMILISGRLTEEKTTEDLFAEMEGDLDVTMGDASEIEIGGLPGLVSDIWSMEDDVAMYGRVALLMVSPTQEFFYLGGGPEEQWEEMQPYVDAMLASIEFFDLAAQSEEAGASDAVDMSSGMQYFVNHNVARDVTILDDTLYAATLGGLVAWDITSGDMRGFTTADGLGHISVNSVTACEIPDLRIIAGTLEGLSVYDPADGEWEDTPLVPELSEASEADITELLCDSENGRLLIGFSSLGVLDLESGEIEYYSSWDDRLAWSAVTDLALDGEDIWVASGYGGITRISGDEVRIYTEADGMPDETAYSVAVAPDGVVWIGAADGLIEFRNGSWTLHGYDTPAKLSSVWDIEITPDGDIWLSTFPYGAGRVCLYDPAEQVCVVEYEDEYNEPIYKLTLDDDNRLAYATNRGVFLIEDGTVYSYIDEEDRLASNYVNSFAETEDGMMWIGTDKGIHLMDPYDPQAEWTTFRYDTPGLGGAWAEDMAISPDGSVWVAVVNGGASLYRDGEWSSFSDVYNFTTVAIDDEENIWFGKNFEGIVVIDDAGEEVMAFNEENGLLPDDDVNVLLSDGDVMWIGSDSGLLKYEDGEIETVMDAEDERLMSSFVRELLLEPDGNLLIGTDSGVVRFDGTYAETVFDFHENDFYDWFTAMALAPDGELWVGTYDGLFHGTGGTDWTRMTIEDGLLTNDISALHVDGNGVVWIGGGGSSYSGGGLIRMVP